MFSDEERDQLLLDILGSLHRLAQDELNYPMISKGTADFIKDRYEYYKQSPEEDIPTQATNGMYEIGDYVVIENSREFPFRGKILEPIKIYNNRNGFEKPGYKVVNLENPQDIRKFSEDMIVRRIHSSLPPPPPNRSKKPTIPAPPNIPKIDK